MKSLKQQVAVLIDSYKGDDPEFKQRLKNLANDLIRVEKREADLRNLVQNELEEWVSLVEQRETLIRSVLDSSTDMIITFDYQGRILEFNYFAEKRFSKIKRMLHGDSIYDFIRYEGFEKDIHKETRQIGAGVFKHRETFNRTITVNNEDSFPASINFTHISTTRASYFTLFIRDLTEELNAKQDADLSRSIAAQASKMASLGEMAGGLAHEINSPLSVIMMNAEVLKKALAQQKDDKIPLIKFSETILETAIRISKIINGLRKFSHDDSHEQKVEVPIFQILEDAASLCRHRYKLDSVTLEIPDCPKDWTVKGNSVALSQVILNLLNNSLDAVQNLQEKVVEIQVTQNENNYEIAVIDSGEKIPPKVRKNLMKPFFTTKPIGKGTGIGLSLSKGIVENHGGTLELDTNYDKTRFVVKLPRL